MVREDRLVATGIGHEAPGVCVIEEDPIGACLVSWGMWQEFGVWEHVPRPRRNF